MLGADSRDKRQLFKQRSCRRDLTAKICFYKIRRDVHICIPIAHSIVYYFVVLKMCVYL